MPHTSVALVTGASRGIGRAIALRLAEQHRVIGAARDEQALQALAADIEQRGGRAEAMALDVSDPEQVVARLEGRAVDVLVHNAGVGTMKPLLELSSAEWQRMLDVNVNAHHTLPFR